MPKSKSDTPGVGHNLPNPEAREKSLLNHLAARRSIDAELEQASALVSAIRKRKNKINNAMKQDGFPVGEVDDALADEGKVRVDIAVNEEVRTFIRRTMALITASQIDLFAQMTPAARTEAEWFDAGYSAGMRGLEPTAPEGCEGTSLQAFMKGWHAAQEKLAWALAEGGVNPERVGAGGGPTAAEIAAQPEEDDETSTDAEFAEVDE